VIPLGWAEVEGLELGELRGKPEDGVLRRVHDDSRRARPGDLFVAINTGTRFVEDALACGAATLLPRDQHAALAMLARLVRDRSEAQVVAVVGSTGKTTTKDALAALCAAVTPTVAADASRNNEIGLPLTVLRLEPDTRVLVTEMGMRGAGQVAELCEIARPTVALVTSIGPEHLELVGTLEDVARANAEALEALPADGIAVVPAGEPLLEPYLDRAGLDVRRFDPTSPTRDGGEWVFRVGDEELQLDLPFTHRHLAGNVLAALTAYDALGLPLHRVHEGAGAIRLSQWRGEVHDLPGGGLVVNDAYNANPTSMRAALVDLAERAGGRRRVAILGQMAELGEESDRYHSDVAALLRELGIEVVVAVGEPARRYLEEVGGGVFVADATGFGEIAEVLRPGDAILVKGSRSVGLEGIPALIQKHSRAWSES
jgi:UDP-N-acetylmuramoyl-tripeptide--D-alanyl-D-alanine ligase